MTVKFVDLRAQHDEIRRELSAAIESAIDESAFTGGSRVTGFEGAFGAFCRARHTIAVGSGTDALILPLRALEVGRGDVVITVANTFMATVEAIIQAGATPEFVDVDPSTSNLDPEQLDEHLSKYWHRDAGGAVRDPAGRRLRAIIPVHLFGLAADMDRICRIAKAWDLEVIEDACQAHGAEALVGGAWSRTGSLGRAAAFSFYPGKNLGALGEAGAVTTDDDELAASIRILRDHGQAERYVHVTDRGVNARMDAIQASVLQVKLRLLDEWNRRRRIAAHWYREELQHHPDVDVPVEPVTSRHVYHLFVVRVPNRERVRHFLTQHGIETGLHYPVPLHRQPALAHLGLAAGSLPITEQLSQEILSLPMHPHLSRNDVRLVSSALLEALTVC